MLEVKEKKWISLEPNQNLSIDISRNLNISPLTAQLLINRGIKNSSEANEFLHPNLSSFLDPFLFNDMQKVVERIYQALEKKEKITIYGDYDVDGITGIAVLYNFLKMLDANVSYYIPHRIEEGYSLNKQAIKKLAQDNVNLIITIDCGTTDFEEVELAKSFGIDVIVVDHHEPSFPLPDAYAIINPKIPDSKYNFENISASGIAFKLIWALSQRLSSMRKSSKDFKDFIFDSIGFVAMGTIADVSPLIGENRIFVSYGLDALKHCNNTGLRELIKKVGLDNKKINTWHISFCLGPRLNAGGRIGSALLCVELLTTYSNDRIQEIILTLEKSNKKRQSIEAKILDEAHQKIQNCEIDIFKDNVIVLAGEHWHSGVIGIVASRLVEEFHRPVVLIALDGEIGKGSARSIQGFHLYNVLDCCREILIDYGGHSMAAGLSIHRDNIKYLHKLLNQKASEIVNSKDIASKLYIDMEINLTSISKEFIKEIRMLEPFGYGNPSPTFLVNNVKIAGEPKLMGTNMEHIQFYVSDGTTSLRAVGFNMSYLLEKLNKSRALCSLVFEPEINTFQRQENIELKLKDIKFL